MHWIRKPRLNSAVATVAVETVLSLLRVPSLNFVMVLPLISSFRDAPPWRSPGIHNHDREYGFRAQGFALPRNDGFNKLTAPQPVHQSRSRGNRNRSLHWPA